MDVFYYSSSRDRLLPSPISYAQEVRCPTQFEATAQQRATLHIMQRQQNVANEAKDTGYPCNEE